MTDPDIVARLRQGWLANWDTDVRFVMVHESEWVLLTNLTTESADEIERLRAERDEARRMYCEEAFCHRFNERGGEATIIDSRQIAHSMGWDCFKENTND